ncbi:hypothetical protein GHT06_019465 [Daphnia sinensis]|uniref:Uncharacterized protein n=1 Tax=Daphnia sinensis TaxID=1820382 RepID=A0AAD5LAQ0_9CRUS|nr:hypothetical protein GHT06_019465 [Daphnia sinensis]
MQRSAVTLVLMALAVTVNSANIISSKSKLVTTTQDPDEAIDQGDPFQYSYAVEAEPTVNETRVRQSKAESSDGQEVIGQYKVLLPDGRLQTVSYTSGPNGYKATVKYVQVGMENFVASSTESNGRSFTVSRAAPRPTTTTTTTTTTTSSPVVEQAAVERQQTQRQSETIDSRTSTSSSRSRQRVNRTRGERLRSTQTFSASSSAVRVEDETGIESMATRLKPSSTRPFGMKTTWRFDGNRPHPDEAFQTDLN